MNQMNNNNQPNLIVSQFRDEDGLYVGKVNVDALSSKASTYEERMDDAFELYHSVVGYTSDLHR